MLPSHGIDREEGVRQGSRSTFASVLKTNLRLPLTGLRGLEIGHFVAAPFCTRLLGDLGADLIKIEPRRGNTA